MATTVRHLSRVTPFHLAEVSPEGHRYRILLIEDSEDSMLLVQFALQEFGEGAYQLGWASNLSDGLDRLSKGGVDIVLLDLGLPESSGAASYAWVRELAREVPVIVLTGDTREETEFSVLAGGVDQYLVKGQVTGLLLMKAIRAALHGAKRRKEPTDVSKRIVRKIRWKFES